MRRGAHARFLLPYLTGLTSPAQVEPAAKAILALDPSPSQLDALVYAFGQGLKAISGDDRSFAAAMTSQAAQQLKALADACERRGVGRQGLVLALRVYLLNNFNGRRCADNLSREGEAAAGPGRALPRHLEYLNAALLADSPITAEQLRPSQAEGAPEPRPYWETPESRALLMKLKRLRFGGGKVPLTDAEKGTTEWGAELAEFLDALAAWTPSRERSEADYFHQKCVLYFGLLDVLPEGRAERGGVFRDFASFLRDNHLHKESRIEWFSHVQNLLGIVNAADAAERAAMLGVINDSQDATLKLYAELTRAL